MADPRRTLLTIEQWSDNSLWGRVEEAGTRVSRQSKPLSWAPWEEALDSDDKLARYGLALRDALYGHPEIRVALEGIFRAPANETWNLHFDVAGAVGEAIRWEMLQDDTPSHVALKGSPRLGRVAADAASPPLLPQALPVPLRIAAFLSASGIPARDEFDSLREAVRNAREQNLQVELTLYVAEDALHAEDLSGEPGVTTAWMPADTLALQQELTRSKPHLLHFFCHGLSDPVQALEFATRAEQLSHAQFGSVLFSVDRLIDCGVLRSAWAVVFNCCDGGRPTAALNSMGFRSVADGGVPASIGMGAPLPADAAAIFSRAFYTALLGHLADLSKTLGEDPQSLDFGEAIGPARQALHEALAGQNPGCFCWALPIIYLHRDPFWIKKAAPEMTPEMAARLATIAGALKALPPGTPDVVRDSIWAVFDAAPAIPPELRPDKFGAFGGATK